MGDAENNIQPSKKRSAGVQLSRDNPGLDDNEDTSELEAGTFKKASEEVLATRRIVKVRRAQTSTPASPAASTASNPFAAIRLVPPASSAPQVDVDAPGAKSKETGQIDDTKSEDKVDEPKGESTAEEEKTDVNEDNATQSESKIDDSKAQSNAEEVAEGEISGKATEADNSETEAKEGDDKEKEHVEATAEKNADEKQKEDVDATAEKNADTAAFSSFHQLSSGQNAFSGVAGTGFSSTSFSFGSLPKDGSSSGSLFGLKSDQPTFGFGTSNNGNSSLFGTSATSIVTKSEGSKFPPMEEVSVETGEENEKAVFAADSVLFEFVDGGWKERGKGELKVNVSTVGTGKARLVMRARGHYRLILNASLFPDMKLTSMDKKGITFACVNSASEGKDGLSTIALKFKDVSIVDEFRAAVMEHKAKTSEALKTPENSP